MRECEYIPAVSVSDLYLTLGAYRDSLSEYSSDADVMEVLPLLQDLILTLNATVSEGYLWHYGVKLTDLAIAS